MINGLLKQRVRVQGQVFEFETRLKTNDLTPEGARKPLITEPASHAKF